MGKKVPRILVVEDERPIANALYLKFQKIGYKVEVSTSGKGVAEIVKKNHIDVILLDLMMPEVDGFDVLTQLKEKNIRTPVMVMSNLGQQEDIAKAKALGAKDYLIKSETPIAEIVKRVKAILHI